MDALKHHELKAEWVEDKHGPAVMLTQEDGWGDDEDHSIIVHPHQLRHVCEHFGILAADPLAKTVTALQRRLLALRDRITDLEAYMVKYSDHKHADLSYEMVNLSALADLADEWCADFMPGEVSPVTPMSPVSTPAESAPPQISHPTSAEQASLI